MGRSSLLLSSCLLFLTACGDDSAPPPMTDGGGTLDSPITGEDTGTPPPPDGSTGTGCASDDDCDDDTYCNGAEACLPDDDRADAFGCVPGTPPACDDGVTCTADSCSEEMRACLHTPPDIDGDGHGDALCVDGAGMPIGDDCADGDARSYPGATEICDGHDEDCNPATFGFLDADGDGAASSACCNGATCGPDCNDADNTVGPGRIDGPPLACDNVDNDCDGTRDEGCPCADGMDRECGSEAAIARRGVCRPGTQFCVGGMFTESCSGGVEPSEETCDSEDDDCDESTDEGVTRTYYVDADEDGYGLPDLPASPAAHECSAPEGYAPNPDDCDDTRAAVSPAGTEVCNLLDDDCDGMPDEGTTHVYYRDMDMDGFGDPAVTMTACSRPMGYTEVSTDCNDAAGAVHPGVADVCNGIDDDCSGTPDPGCACTDGMTRMCGTTDTGECMRGTQRCVGGSWADCVGAILARPEACNGLDDDCDGTTDEMVLNTYYRDADGDSFGAAAMTMMACSLPAGYSTLSTDCNDMIGSINPAAAERCNAIDDNCDGMIDPGCMCTDGMTRACGMMPPMGVCRTGTQQCIAGTWGSCVGDVSPGTESCNMLDDDCDGMTDETLTVACYVDADSDGRGAGAVVQRCPDPARMATFGGCPVGYSNMAGDCNDSNGSIRPGGTETCNGIDDDCDTMIDDGVLITFYRDADRDGYGAMAMTMMGCSAPSGYVAAGGDCNDASAAVYPTAFERCNAIDDNCVMGVDEGCMCTDGMLRACGMSSTGVCRMGTQQCVGGMWGTCVGNVDPGTETCNGLDDDCDSSTDEMLTVTCYADGDSDGYGAGSAVARCPDPARPMFGNCPAGYTNVATDCNDSNGSIRPGGTEACNGADDDCDGMTDEGVRITYYRDADFDGYGVSGTTMQACTAPSGYVAASGDCNDGNAAIYPGAFESCDGVDNNCSMGITDEPRRTFYQDSDSDLYGNAARTMMACTPPMGYVEYAGDCNDANPTIRPGAVEICNGVDDDCDSSTDEPPAAPQCAGENPFAVHVTAWACTGGTCDPATCSTNWADCDGNVVNGCETDLRINLSHCGACGNACGPGALCTAGSCDTLVDLSAGAGTACATWSSGRVVCWGNGDAGETNEPGFVDTPEPRLLEDVAGVSLTAISHSDINSGTVCAMNTAPSSPTFCWGRNDTSQVGDGGSVARNSPVVIDASSGAGTVNGIAAGRQHTCAIWTRQLYCWGRNNYGELGGGIVGAGEPAVPTFGWTRGFPPSVPMLASSATDSVCAGSYFTCFVEADAEVRCVGSDNFGKLGNGPGGNTHDPTAYLTATGGTQVSCGDEHACVVRTSAPYAQCWGNGGSGRLGNDMAVSSQTPVNVFGGHQFTQIDAGYAFTCARRADGTVWCWGQGGLGQLGTRTGGAPLASSNRPVQVVNTAGVPLTGIVEVATGRDFACARSTTQVLCWGYNDQGQLGRGTISAMAFDSARIVDGF